MHGGPPRARPFPPRQPPPNHSIDGDQGDRFNDRGQNRPYGNSNNSNLEFRRNDSLGSSGPAGRHHGGYGRFDYYDHRRASDRPPIDSSAPRMSMMPDPAHRSSSLGTYDHHPSAPLSRESSTGSIRSEDNKDRSGVGSSSGTYGNSRGQVGNGGGSSSSSVPFEGNGKIPAFRNEGIERQSSFGSYSSSTSSRGGFSTNTGGRPPHGPLGKKGSAPPPPPGPPPMRRSASDGGGSWSSRQGGNMRFEDRGFYGNNRTGMSTSSSAAPQRSAIGGFSGPASNTNKNEPEPGEMIEEGEVIVPPSSSAADDIEEEGQVTIEPSTAKQTLEQATSKLPPPSIPPVDSILASSSTSKTVKSTFLDESISKAPKLIPKRETSADSTMEMEEQDVKQRKREKKHAFEESIKGQGEEESEGKRNDEVEVEEVEEPVRRGRPGRKPKKKKLLQGGQMDRSTDREGLVIDTSFGAEDEDDARRTTEEGVVKKKRKKRTRRLEEEDESWGREEGGDHLQQRDVDNEEEEEEMADPESTKDDPRGSILLKKRRKSRMSGMSGNDDSVAPTRAAKKRAVELIAKPKTPSGVGQSMPGFGEIDPESGAQLPGDLPPKQRLAVRQQSSGAGSVGTNGGGRKFGRFGGDDDDGALAKSPTTTMVPSIMSTTTASLLSQAARWEELKRAFLARREKDMSTSSTSLSIEPLKAAMKSKMKIHGVPINLSSMSTFDCERPVYHFPEDAPGWQATEEWAANNKLALLECLKRRSTLERNHAHLIHDEYLHLNKAWKVLKEQQRLIAEVQAQPSKHRYPSRNNPAAVAMELGHEHGAAELARREKERRKNAATLPDMEPPEQYLASVFDRKHVFSTDGRSPLCSDRPITQKECVSASQNIPLLLVPSALGCNCTKAVIWGERKPWTDAEKCLFLDKFQQCPKDFQRIASYFRDKSTEDIIAFYYDTKKQCDYKGYLGEHHYRRRNRDPGELSTIRETYLGKLGVKLPLKPDMDATTPLDSFVEPIDKVAAREIHAPCVLLNRVDAFPRPAGTDPKADIFPRPAFFLEFPVAVDPSDMHAWLLKATS